MSKNAIVNAPRLTHLDVLYVDDKGRYIFLIVQGFRVDFFCESDCIVEKIFDDNLEFNFALLVCFF